MTDKGMRKTDLAVKRAEWRLSRTYRQAQQEIDDKLKEWQRGHTVREAQLRQRVKDGKMTQADFDAWMRGQVFQGKQWQAKAQQIRDTLLHADQEAMRIVRDGKVGVFTDNANFMGQRIADKANISASFNMYDEHTVARLLTKDPMLLPKLPPEKAINKDKAYGYYNRLVSSAITQGIIQGESVQKIAQRIAGTACNGCYSSAVRTARTAYTCAQNAGRIEAMRQALELGIHVKKKWVAAHDGATREAHLKLHDQVREVEEPFDSILGQIMYPCDPYADPANVYNCRCALIEVKPEYSQSGMQRQDNETGEPVGDMTYEEWAAMKAGETPEEAREPSTEQVEQVEQTQIPVDYFDMETTREISSAMGEAIGRPVDLQGMDKTLAARTARLYTDLANEYGMRASSIGMNNRRAAFGQVNHKYTGEKKLTFSKSMFESPDKLREVLMGEQRKGQTIPIRGGVILDYVQTHEFAHLFGSSLEDGYYNANQPFWREIGTVMREYIDDRSRPLGKYAAQNIDEFMAEAFADGYLNRQPTEYGRKVKEIVDKYFGRRK